MPSAVVISKGSIVRSLAETVSLLLLIKQVLCYIVTMPAPPSIIELVERFENNYADYVKPHYLEEQTRVEFINPFFKALGWDVDNSAGYAEAYKDVLHEAALKMGGTSKSPDYSFRIGGTRKFFLEAKRPGLNIETDLDACFQLRSYSYTAGLPVAVLTNFRHLAIYDGRVEPQRKDGPNKALLQRWSFKDYVGKWDDIAAILARDSILKGAFDKYAAVKTRKGVVSFDVAFLNEIEGWRASLATHIAAKNALSEDALNFAVGRIIDRIIFLRICEERGIEPGAPLAALKGGGGKTYEKLVELFHKADAL
jgi:hypothetical protein